MDSNNTQQAAEADMKSRLVKSAAYYATFIILGLTGAVIGPTLSRLAEHTHTQLNQISFIFPAASLGYLIGSLLAGRLYDLLPGHRILVTVLLVVAGALTLIPLAGSIWVLTVILLILNISTGAIDVGGNTLLVWVHRDKVGPFMNALHFFFGVGAFLSPIIVAQALKNTGEINLAFWIMALMALPVAVWLFFIRSPKSIAETGGEQKGPVSVLLVVLVSLFLFIYVGAEIGFGNWISTYATSLNLADEATAAYLASAFWGALTLGRLLSIPLAVRFSLRRILSADLVGCLISLLVIVLFPSSLTALWIGALGLGFSMAAVFPTTISLAERFLTITGSITSYFFIGASLGGMFLPWLIGQLFEPVGPRVTMFIILGDLLVGVAVFAFLMARARQTKTEAVAAA
jgi:MFS transporter, FHS family, Na+ dependent glucose transporter 1